MVSFLLMKWNLLNIRNKNLSNYKKIEMKYIAFVLLSTILFILSCSSKTTIQTLDRKFDKKSYRLPSEIEDLEKSDKPWQYEAYGMLYYTWIGDYKKALELEQLYPTTYDDLTEEEISHFKTFKPVDAKEYILKRSKKERIIMINENHHSSINRTFATSLLQGLFDNGYKLLCMKLDLPYCLTKVKTMRTIKKENLTKQKT